MRWLVSNPLRGLSYSVGDMPAGNGEALSLPSSVGLSIGDQERVIQTIAKDCGGD